MRSKALVWFVACAFSQGALASSLDDGSSFASSLGVDGESIVSSGNSDMSGITWGDQSGRTGLFGSDSISSQALQNVTDCETNPPDPNDQTQEGQARYAECLALGFSNFNYAGKVNAAYGNLADDPALQPKDIEALLEQFGLTGTTTEDECVVRTVTNPPQTQDFECFKGYDVSLENYATVGREVVIDADSNFQCDKTVQSYETVKCSIKTILSCSADICIPITNLKKSGDFGQISLGGSSTSWTLKVGSPGVNDISRTESRKKIFWQSTYTFDIENLQEITKFILQKTHADNTLAVWLNGNLIYHSEPDGKDIIQCSTPKVSKGIDILNGDGCVTHFWPKEGVYPNKDVKKYLVEGKNTVKLKLFVEINGYGEGFAIFQGKATCQTCSVSTVNECETLEARSQ